MRFHSFSFAIALTFAAAAGCMPPKPIPTHFTPATSSGPIAVSVVSLIGSHLNLEKHGFTAFEVSSDRCPLSFDVDAYISEMTRGILESTGRYRNVPIQYYPLALDNLRTALRARRDWGLPDPYTVNGDSMSNLRPLLAHNGASLAVVFTDFATQLRQNREVDGIGVFKDSFMGMATAARGLYANLKVSAIDGAKMEVLAQDARSVGAAIDEALWVSRCSEMTPEQRASIDALLKDVLRREVATSLQKLGLV